MLPQKYKQSLLQVVLLLEVGVGSWRCVSVCFESLGFANLLVFPVLNVIFQI